MLLNIIFVQCLFANWRPVIEARSVEMLLEAEAEVLHHKNLVENCQAEQSKRQFPNHCMELLGIQLRTATFSAGLWNATDRLCQEQGHQLSLTQLEMHLEKDWMPPGCQSQLKELYKDLLYAEGQNSGPLFEKSKHHEKDQGTSGLL